MLRFFICNNFKNEILVLFNNSNIHYIILIKMTAFFLNYQYSLAIQRYLCIK